MLMGIGVFFFFSGIEEIFVISFVSISVECNECGRL